MARRRLGGRVARVAAVVAAVIVVLLGGLALLLQTGEASRRVKELVVPRASAALGRQITVRDARLRLFPSPRVALAGAQVAGRPGEPPLAELDSLDVTLRLWPLVRSLGKDVQVAGIRLVKPVVNLVRAADGSWNFEGLGKGAGAPAGPKAGRGAEGQQARVVVSEATIEDGAVRLIDRSGRIARGEAAVAISRIDLAARDVGVGEPLRAKLSAALAGPDKNFDAEIRASELPASAAALGPGRYPQLQGSLAVRGLDLARLRALLPPSLTRIMTGGRVDAQAKLGTDSGKYRVDGVGKLSQVKLRGEPAQGGFTLHAIADPASGAARVEIDRLSLKGPGVELGGTLTADAKPRRVRFAIAGPLLDLGQVMGLLPQQKEPEPKQPLALTAAQRRAVGALDVQGTLDIAKVVRGGLTVNGFKARAALDRGVLVLQQAQGELFGGRVDAGGTRVDLSPAAPTWRLQAKLAAVDLKQAFTALAGHAPLEGKMAGTLALDGAGIEWAQLEKELTGQGSLNVQQGALTTADLGGHVLGAVAQGLRAAGRTAAASEVAGAGGKTELRDLAAQFTVKDGAMSLARPLSFSAPFGQASLGGRIGLGGQLALQGTANVSRESLQRLTGGSGIPLPAALSVPLRLGGTLSSPAIGVDAGPAVAGLVTGAAKQKAQQLQQGAQERVKREARRGLGDALKRLGK